MTEFGCFLPTFPASSPLDVGTIRETAVTAEDAGFAHLWVGDHFVWNVGMLAPLATLAHVAAVTERIRLGTGIYLLPLRHPTITAKDVTSVDVLSGGRLILGVGIGGENPLEYEAVGVSPSDKGQRLEESLAALRHILQDEDGGFDAEFATLPDFTMAPPADQDPVPVWIGGRAQVVVERAARVGQGWFPVWVSARRIRESAGHIEELRGGLDGFSIALNIFVHVAEDVDSARDTIAAHMQNAYGLPFDKFERYAAIGSPEDVASTLREYVEAGVTDFALNLTGPDPIAQLDRLAEDVIPQVS